MKKIEEKEPIVLEIEGQKLFGILHLPTNQSRVPGVLMFHGLAGNKTGRFRIYVHLAKELARMGIASLRIDFRGCGDSDGEFSETTLKGFLQDSTASLKFLLNHSSIDPQRIGIFGRSFGAAIALLAAAEEYKKIKSLALWAPLFNTHQWLEKWHHYHDINTPKHVQEQLLNVEGQLGSFEFFDDFFNLNLDQTLDGLQHIPLLHIHGEKDPVINIHHADLYKEKRRHADAPSKFITLPEGDHDFANRPDQLAAIAETVEWFKSTL